MAAGEVPKSIRASLYIDGKPAENTLQNVKAQSQQLKRELDKLVMGTDAWNQKMKEVQANQQILKNVKDEVNGLGGAFGWLRTEIGKLGVLAVGAFGFQFITQQFQSIIAANAKLSDSLAAVRQTTGLTEDQVRGLNQELKKIDTRTARNELLKIAEIGGQFNVPTDQLKGFVEQMDKANVVLGTEFKGGAEEITQQLALLRNNFSDIKTDRVDQDLGHIGNALVVLAQEGAATAPVVADFSQRLSPLIATAHLTSGAILGLSATLQELAVNPERGGTAVVRIFAAMNSNVYAFAQVAGVAADKFKLMLQDNPIQAFTQVLEGFKKGGANVTAMNQVMDQLEVNSVGAKEVFAKLSQNTGLMTERIGTATGALTNMDSITQQFNINNNTFGATLDKLGKKFATLTSNSAVTGFMSSLVVLTSKLIDGFNNHAKAVANFVKILLVATTAWAGYKLITALATAEKLNFIKALLSAQKLEELEIIATTAMSAAQALLTGNIAKARQEWVLLNTVLETNPWGLAAAAIAGVITALVLFNQESSIAEKQQEALNKVKATAIDQTEEERDKINDLVAILNDENESREDKLRAVKALRDLLPDHLKAYSDEAILAGKAKTEIDKYIDSLERKAEAEAAFQDMVALKKDIRKLKSGQGGEQGFWQSVGTYAKGMAPMFFGDNSDKSVEKKNRLEEIAIKEAQLNTLKKSYGADIKNNLLRKNPTDTNATGSGNGIDDHNKMTPGQLEAHVEDLKKNLATVVKDGAEYVKITKDLAEANKVLRQIKKDSGEGGGTGGEPKKKQEDFLNKSKELTDAVKQFNAEALANLEATNQKELEDTANKYDKMITREKQFLEENKKNKNLSDAERQKHQAEIDQLEIDKRNAVNAVKERQEKDLNDKITALRNSLNDRYGTELDKERDQINTFYDDLLDNASDDINEWAEIEFARQQDLTDAKIRDEKRFQEAVKNIEQEGDETADDKLKVKLAKIKNHYDDEIEALKKKFTLEKQATKEFQEALDKVNANRKKATDQAVADDAADKRKKVAEIELTSIKQVANAGFSIATQNSRTEADYKIAQLEKQRDAELKSKNLSEAQKQAINEKYDKQEADIKLQQWKAEQKLAIEQAIINGAVAMTKVSAQTGVLTFAFSPIVALETAAQVAIIAAQKPPQFAEGGMSDGDPAGFVNQATYFSNSASGRPFVAGEAGREWIAPNWMVRSPRYANLIGMLEVARREKRMYAAGGFTGTGGAPSPVDMSATNNLLAMMIDKLDEVNKRPSKIEFSNRVFQEGQQRMVEIINRANPK